MRAFRLARIAGIDVNVHVSWFIIFALLTWSLATGYFPLVVRPADDVTNWILGAVASILLFASVLVHELAHSFVARSQGLEARSIPLFIFGGVSSLGSESPRPWVEFIVAVVGPLTSLVLAGIAFALTLALAGSPELQALFGYLAVVNALLGLFNLIPGFPLDGGRVLRSILWQAQGSLRRATETAAAVGQLVAYLFVAWGFIRLLGNDLFGGLWIAAIGWFLYSAASASVEQVRLEQTLRGTRVKTMLRPEPVSVEPTETVSNLIDQYLLPLNRRAMPVTEDGRLVGVVTLGDVRGVPPERRATTRVGEVMGGRDEVATVEPDDSLAEALETLAEGDYEQLPVVDRGRLVGMLTRADVLRQFQLREALEGGRR